MSDPNSSESRISVSDVTVGMLPYLDTTAQHSWAAHHDQHELQDKALELALENEEHARAALRELLDGKIAALAALVEANRQASIVALDAAYHAREDLANTQHEAINASFAAHQRLHEMQNAADARTMKDHAEAHSHEHTMQQRAIELAKDGQDARLEAMNEFRSQLRTQASSFAPREYVDSRFQTIVDHHNLTDITIRGMVTRELMDASMKSIIDRLTALDVARPDTVTRDVLQVRLAPLENARNAQDGSLRTLAVILSILVFLVPLAVRFLFPPA